MEATGTLVAALIPGQFGNGENLPAGVSFQPAPLIPGPSLDVSVRGTEREKTKKESGTNKAVSPLPLRRAEQVRPPVLCPPGTPRALPTVASGDTLRATSGPFLVWTETVIPALVAPGSWGLEGASFDKEGGEQAGGGTKFLNHKTLHCCPASSETHAPGPGVVFDTICPAVNFRLYVIGQGRRVPNCARVCVSRWVRGGASDPLPTADCRLSPPLCNISRWLCLSASCWIACPDLNRAAELSHPVGGSDCQTTNSPPHPLLHGNLQPHSRGV
ncbi:hypothetical protein AAFF_G00285390 [Aldrovandia affinis]|uniref:Uncharacterized protein n=1 Tax=Aldrovandia affinis TaxID=143900 RepID=A0AAD7X1T5_9TELE|nr:hypothetical protein AAFF_G00285390 [Aldrovandia affinis]